MENAFQHLSLDDRIVADFAYRKAIEEFPPDTGAFAPFLAGCILTAIEELGETPVASHSQILAYRHVRCCIRAGTCDCGDC